jgi:hypothetical protein
MDHRLLEQASWIARRGTLGIALLLAVATSAGAQVQLSGQWALVAERSDCRTV